MNNRKVLLLGGSGQLGRQLSRQTPDGIDLLVPDSASCSLANRRQMQSAIQQASPTLIVNAAAYTQVDKAESAPDRAFSVNAEGVAWLAEAAGKECRIIHVSTDFVFDGTKTTPYRPDDSPRPLNAYGRSKLAGESYLQGIKPDSSVIIRTAWLYAPFGRNFVTSMLRLMEERDSLSIVADRRGTPTSTATLADVIWRLAARPDLSGIFHWTDQGEASWFEFAQAIQHRAVALGLLQRAIPLLPITTEEYPTPALRPAYSVLDKTSTCEQLGINGTPWQDELQKVLEQIKES